MDLGETGVEQATPNCTVNGITALANQIEHKVRNQKSEISFRLRP